MKSEDYKYQPTNREKAIKAKHGYDWCLGCDRAQVPEGKKCPVCGRKKYRKKIRI